MRIVIYTILILSLLSCSNNTAEISNPKKGALIKSKILKQTGTKKFPLDSVTAPKIGYTQLYFDSTNTLNLTFLNSYNNSIYLYNYKNLSFVKKISFTQKGPNGISKPWGYFIKNLDSIYLYNKTTVEIILANAKSEVLNKHSLIDNEDLRKSNWITLYPQYHPKSTNPFIEINNNLLLSGFSVNTIPDELINDFKHTLKFNIKTNNVGFMHTYPKELYGNNYNWGDPMLNMIYPVYRKNRNEIIYSYPVSHFVYKHDLTSNNIEKIYAGSNFASNITSFDASPKKRIPRNKIGLKVNQQDLYGALLYDKWRKVFYRFVLKAIPNATVKTNLKKKKVAVIIMDEDFNYLGEKVLGAWRNWNWENSFITEEGLNIEFLDNHNIDEVALIFKIFQTKDI